MSNINADVIRVQVPLESDVASTIREGMLAFATDAKTLNFKATGGTVYKYYDSTKLAGTSGGSSGSLLIGVAGISGLTPDGGSSGAGGNLQNMLIGLKAYIDAVPAAVISGSGTAYQIPMFTDTGIIGDSIISATGPLVAMNSSQDGPTLFIVSNTEHGVSAISGLSLQNELAAAIYVANTNYTDELAGAGYLTLSVGSTGTGINFAARKDSGDFNYYIGLDMESDTLFARLNTKRLLLTNMSLGQDSSGSVGGLEITPSVDKDDTFTRYWSNVSIVPTLNTGATNTTTDLTVLNVDTVNTSVTGLTVHLAKMSWGGSERFRFDPVGNLFCQFDGGVYSMGLGTPDDIAAGNTEYMLFRHTGSDSTGISVFKTGTGTYRNFSISTGGSARFTIDTDGNICIGATSVGGGVGVIHLHNASTVPTSNALNAGLIYVENGALKFRGSTGTVTTVAPA